MTKSCLPCSIAYKNTAHAGTLATTCEQDISELFLLLLLFLPYTASNPRSAALTVFKLPIIKNIIVAIFHFRHNLLTKLIPILQQYQPTNLPFQDMTKRITVATFPLGHNRLAALTVFEL